MHSHCKALPRLYGLLDFIEDTLNVYFEPENDTKSKNGRIDDGERQKWQWTPIFKKIDSLEH